MANNQWIFKGASDTERFYEIKTSTLQDGKVCSPQVNKLLNDYWEKLRQKLVVGFYFIKDIHQQKKYNSDVNEDVARFSYKENLDKKFVDMGLSVKIQPLLNFVSECLVYDKNAYKIKPSELIGEIVHVQSFELLDTEYNGMPTKVNKVIWTLDVDHQKPELPGVENQVQEDHTETIVENQVQEEPIEIIVENEAQEEHTEPNIEMSAVHNNQVLHDNLDGMKMKDFKAWLKNAEYIPLDEIGNYPDYDDQ